MYSIKVTVHPGEKQYNIEIPRQSTLYVKDLKKRIATACKCKIQDVKIDSSLYANKILVQDSRGKIERMEVQQDHVVIQIPVLLDQVVEKPTKPRETFPPYFMVLVSLLGDKKRPFINCNEVLGSMYQAFLGYFPRETSYATQQDFERTFDVEYALSPSFHYNKIVRQNRDSVLPPVLYYDRNLIFRLNFKSKTGTLGGRRSNPYPKYKRTLPLTKYSSSMGLSDV